MKLLIKYAYYFVFLTYSITSYASCAEDTLWDNKDGEYLSTLSGSLFEVLPGDDITSLLWLPMDDLIICERALSVKGTNYIVYYIFNKDDKEEVAALKIK